VHRREKPGVMIMDTIRVELHAHTHHSEDSLMLPEKMLAICAQRGIDKLAITDHNRISGALMAAAIDPSRVIIGEEVKTTKGELLAFFVREAVPAGLGPREAIGQLREQGAFISVSHPLDSVRSGAWKKDDLLEVLPLVDALEVFNARGLLRPADRWVEHLALEHGLLRTAGSDAHSYRELGTSGMRLPDFSDPESFRVALGSAQVIRRRSPYFVHLLSRYASLRKALGWKAPSET
jgi:predicted metal-dependent phosphoesterase TrpH